MKFLPKQLPRIAIRENIHKTYSKFFGPCLTDMRFGKSSDQYEFLVTPSICRKVKGTGDPYLATSSLLALYDEYSSISFIAKDKTGRGGLSVQLSMEMFQRIEPWSILTMHISTEKIGKFIGFSSIDVTNEKGEVVAKGDHIKFMALGRLWDLLFSPTMIPLVYAIYYRFIYNTFKTEIDPLLDGIPREEVIDQIRSNPLFQVPESIFDNFAFTKLDESSTVEMPHYHKYKLKVTPETKNYVGYMHGGAVACAIEEACYHSRYGHHQQHEEEEKICHSDDGYMIGRISTRYLNGTEVMIAC
jgi:hypothetical protein